MTTLTTLKPHDQRGNTKPSGRSRGWCFTLNNWTSDEYEKIKTWLTTRPHYVLGKEVGESGTPHLQGYVYDKNQIKFETLKNLCPRMHIEPAKGSPKQNLAYCTKDGDFETNIQGVSNVTMMLNKLRKRYENVTWQPWQQLVIDSIKTEPDSRTINWVYDPVGNRGKTFLCKYIKLATNCILADGKKDNVYHAIAKKLEEDELFDTVILDIPRHNLEYINYGLLEKIKDGLIYSGKYEGRDCIFDNVHLWVFANERPDTSKMSADRWNLITLT